MSLTKIKIDLNAFILCLLLAVPTMSCNSLNPNKEGTFPPDHAQFNNLLKKHVDERGNVNYKQLKNERSLLDEYLGLLSEHPPNESNWTKEDQIAYWINAYNAFTLALVLDHYPIASIKDIGSKIQIPFVNTPWDIKFIEIGDEEYDLNNIEHNILRENFNEPRIHFAIVCASFSCPKLRNEAYRGGKLEQQLEDQARNFLRDKSKNEIGTSEIHISKIFSWFKGDFTKDGSLIEFLNLYSQKKIEENAKVSYMDYDWSLNDQ
ncbi:MAG: DUF547 domain-containing protein [Cyclobacteriaceae bacterium]